jgi:RNA polymerase sigma-70 factor (ECF subfamily)
MATLIRTASWSTAIKNAVYHHCFAIVRNEDVAEDIAQETFISAYYALTTFDAKKGRLSTWLFTIATRKALNWLKRFARELKADDDVVAQITSEQPGPNQVALYSELHDAVKNLQPKYGVIISLYYSQGLPYKDIATILHAPEGSIKVWMQRAKKELRNELA